MTTGFIGSANLVADTDTDLTGGGLANDMIVNVAAVNRGAALIKFRLAIGSGASPTDADYIEYDTIMPPNGMLERTGISMSAGEKIWVRSNVATVSARASGLPVL